MPERESPLQLFRRRGRWALSVEELREAADDPEAKRAERAECIKAANNRLAGGRAVAARILRERDERLRRGY